MVSIKIGFSRGTSPTIVGHAIMAVLKTPYSHTYLRFEDGTIFEAEWLGTRVVAYADWIRDSIIVEEVRIEISEERLAELKQFVEDNKGIPYGYFQLVRILFRELGRSSGLYDNGSRRYICSELIARALKDILGFTTDDLDLITPRQIYYLVKGLSFSLLQQREI